MYIVFEEFRTVIILNILCFSHSTFILKIILYSSDFLGYIIIDISEY